MRIYPAIDILDKSAVRLFKGNYSNKTIYSNNPLEIAINMEKKGVKFLHVVDLDGAKNGERINKEVIREIALNTSLKIEVGGGIRTLFDIEEYLELGLDRIILGSKALDLAFLEEAIKNFSKEKIVAGVDIENGNVKINGWLEDSNQNGITLLSSMKEVGLKYAIVTDITKDGTLSGPNIDLYKSIIDRTGLEITLSGGVSSIDDIVKAREALCSAVIIGKAYYEGKIRLIDVLKEEEW